MDNEKGVKKSKVFRIVIILVIVFAILFNVIKGVIIKNEISSVVNEKIASLYESDKAEQYDIKNISYKITGLNKQEPFLSNVKDEYYRLEAEISCEAAKDLSYDDKIKVSDILEGLFGDFGMSGYKTKIGVAVTRIDRVSHYSMITTKVNGEKIKYFSSYRNSKNYSK